jgi:hypothetical protein
MEKQIPYLYLIFLIEEFFNMIFGETQELVSGGTL